MIAFQNLFVSDVSSHSTDFQHNYWQLLLWLILIMVFCRKIRFTDVIYRENNIFKPTKTVIIEY